MNIKISIPLVLFAFTTVFTSRAKTADPITLSLKDAMDYAVQHNNTAKNARIDIENQKAKNAEVVGVAYPQLSTQGKFVDYIDPVKTFIPAEFFGGPAGTFQPVVFTPKFSNQANANASQILFNSGVLIALQARKTLIKLFEQQASMTEEEIRYNVQVAYYSLVISRKQYENLKEVMRIARDASNDVAELRKAGFAEKLDVDRSEVQINNLANDSMRIDNLIVTGEQMLKYQMGMDINKNIVLTDTTLTESLAKATELMTQELEYDHVTTYNLLQTQLMLNEYDLKRYKFQNLPSFTAFGSAGYNYSANNFSDVFNKPYIWTSLVGLQLDVPIFDGLQKRNRVKQAKFAVEKNKNNIENVKLGLDFQVSQSKSNLKNALLTLESRRRNEELANSVLDLTRKKYKAGVGSNLDVTVAQNDLLTAQNNYFSSLLDVINAQSNLQKALGYFK